MKCFILTRATERLKVPNWLFMHPWLEPIYVVDNDEQRKKLRGVIGEVVIAQGVPGPPFGASIKRDWIARNLAPKGEWVAFLDDNVHGFYGLPFQFSQRHRINFIEESPPVEGTTWRALMDTPLSPSHIKLYCLETIAKAEELGTIYCGFTCARNYFFRKVKWQYSGSVRAQFAFYKNDGSSWLPIQNLLIEDIAKSADVIARYGCIVVNRFMRPEKVEYESGGIGSYAERRPWLQQNCTWLLAKYPGLIEMSRNSDTNVNFRKSTLKSIEQWRRSRGLLNE